MVKMRKKLKIDKHMLIPKHVKLSEKEKEDLFKRLGISSNELPKILKDDPAIQTLGAKAGDVIKVMRKSPTAGEAVFYRGVTNV
jgi:DNA-directed RNA polymerase subunit H